METKFINIFTEKMYEDNYSGIYDVSNSIVNEYKKYKENNYGEKDERKINEMGK